MAQTHPSTATLLPAALAEGAAAAEAEAAAARATTLYILSLSRLRRKTGSWYVLLQPTKSLTFLLTTRIVLPVLLDKLQGLARGRSETNVHYARVHRDTENRESRTEQ